MSVQKLPCYDYIIGLYQGSCDCYDGRPEDYNTSDSGLYISDLLEPKFIDGLLNCDQGASIWELMEIVRNLAIRNFVGDTNALLMQSNKLSRSPFYGAIGRAKYSRTLALTSGYYAGVRIFCADIVSGYLRIKKIGTLFSQTGTISVTVYDSYGNSLGTYSLATEANKHKVTTLPSVLELDLHNEYTENMEYFILYQVGSNQPKNNDLTCRCGGRWIPVFNKKNPYWYQTKSNRQYGWTEFLMAGGYYGSALPDWYETPVNANNNMNGLTLDVELGCKVAEVLCKDELDYDGNTLAQAMAIAIQNEATTLFLDKILASPNLNRITMAYREDLLRRIEAYDTKYKEMIAYIAENADIKQNDCFECKDIVEMIKTGILS